MLFQFCLQAGIKMVKAREHFTMMRIMDDEDLVEKFFRFSHESAVCNVMRRFQVVKHFRDCKRFERFDITMYIPLRRLSFCGLIELGQEFIYVQALFADSRSNGVMAAAAVIEMQTIQEPNRIRISFYNVS